MVTLPSFSFIALLGVGMLSSFLWGMMRGFKLGVELAVRADLDEKGIAVKLDDTQRDFIAEVRDAVSRVGETPGPDYFQWLRRWRMKDSAEAQALYRNVDYRRALDDQ